MKEYLTFQLYGPMAAWGEIAVGGVRHVALCPTKSAMIGLVAAALGYKREQEQLQLQLANSLEFGFKVFSDGSLLRDFHTIEVPKNDRKRQYYTRRQELLTSPGLNTILSTRDYRTDAFVIAALSLTKDAIVTLSEIHEALLKPKFTLYLGRKSCPLSVPLFPQLVKNQNKNNNEIKGIKFALDSYPQLYITEMNNDEIWLPTNEPYYVWEGDGLDIKATMVRQRQDMPISRKRWQFRKRPEQIYKGGSC